MVESAGQGTTSFVDQIMCLCVYVIMLLIKLMDYAIGFSVHDLVMICCKYKLLWIMILYVDMPLHIVYAIR